MVDNKLTKLPEGWKKIRLGDVCQVISGQSPASDTYRNTAQGLPFFQGKADFGEEYPIARSWCISPIKVAKPGDILISVRAPVGPTNTANVECCIGRGLAAIRCGEHIDQRFLLFCLRFLQEEIANKGSGSTFQAINRDDLVNFNIPLAPLSEQKRIAAILNERLAAVEQARKASETRLNAAQALTSAYLREAFESEEARTWKRQALGDFVTEFRYGTSNKSSGKGYVTLRIPNVIGNTLDLNDIKTVAVDDQEFDRLKLIDGDLLFVRTNGSPENVGRSALYDSSILKANGMDSAKVIYASYLIRARLDNNRILPAFVQNYCQSRLGRKAIFANSKTTAGQFNINTQGLGAIPIPVPSLETQQRVVTELQNRTSAIMALVNASKEGMAIVNAIPSSLFKQAFSGLL